MAWNGLKRNELDFILTDLLPVELSELFSLAPFYDYLSERSNLRILDEMCVIANEYKTPNNITMFNGDKWCTTPLQYDIAKGNGTTRKMSLIQPISALNLYVFIKCYQKEILNLFQKRNSFSIRYQVKNRNLYYKKMKGKNLEYFQKTSKDVGHKTIQQLGTYFKIAPYESLTEFIGSDKWIITNFKYKCYAKIDYKSCFDSIYTHAYKWIIERNTSDSKNANNSHLYITIDRILQNINGRSSNGLLVGPEFSRMTAEILLQAIDSEIKTSLGKEGLKYNEDYVVFRYVDDIYAFANNSEIIGRIIEKYSEISSRYRLHLNELKLVQGETPFLGKDWLEVVRSIVMSIENKFFVSNEDYKKMDDDAKAKVKKGRIYIDGIKDSISVVMKKYPEENRSIVSYLLTTMLNNIKNRSQGYILFGKEKKKAFLILDFCFYIYAYFPSFEQTRKLISIIFYINDELNLSNENMLRDKLRQIIVKYSFIFKKGNLFDLCDWLPLMSEYGIFLETTIEDDMFERIQHTNDPILLANYLIYSKYYEPYAEQVSAKVEDIVNHKMDKIHLDQGCIQKELWYIYIFHNCPYLSDKLRTRMREIIEQIFCLDMENDGKEAKRNIALKAMRLVGEYLARSNPTSGEKPLTSFFDWSNNNKFGERLTFRTYQKSIFKRYKNKHSGYSASIE